MMNLETIGQLKQAANGMLDALLPDLLPGGRRVGHEYHAASVSGGPGSSLVVEMRAGSRCGVWCDFAQGPEVGESSGDVIDLVMASQRVDRIDAIKWLRQWLGADLQHHRPARSEWTPEQRAAIQVANEKNQRRARKLWLSTQPLAGTVAETYLREARGLGIDWLGIPEALRFVAELDYWEEVDGKFQSTGRYPAILAEVTGMDGEFMGVWRIWLAADGSDKAPVDDPRRGLGPTAGGGVWLWRGDGPRVQIAEGIETALAVREMSCDAGSTVAATSTSGIISLTLPDALTQPVIYVDNDPPSIDKETGQWRRWPDGRPKRPGPDAAASAESRFRKEGRTPRLVFPREAKDFNDVLLLRKGLKQMPKVFEEAES